MPDFLGTLLTPIRWLIELVLVAAHTAWEWIGLNPDDGWTWILSILILVIIVRSAMIPLLVRQVKSQRGMMELAPEIKKIQDKYRGKRDQFSQQSMQQELQALYKRTGSNPLSGCWPLLVQMPIFFSLFSVLNHAQQDLPGVGLMNADLAHSFANASVLGAPLKATLVNNGGNPTVIAVAIGVILLMIASQFYTQFQITAKNISQAAKESPTYRTQQTMLYVLPFVVAISGLMFPLGVMSYWLLSNIWTMGQQWWIIRQMPTPGSEAAKQREARLRASGKWTEAEAAKLAPASKSAQPAQATVQRGQRQQPKSKARAKKSKGRGSGSPHGEH